MSDDDAPFNPQRYEVLGINLSPGLDTLGDFDRALADLEKELHLDVAPRRAMAAGLASLGWRASPHLAEHLAWLLARETDALSACSLFYAVLATHPSAWRIWPWQHALLRSTPFALLRTVVMDHLLADASIDFDTEEGQALRAAMDPNNPEHRALLCEHDWLVGDPGKREIKAMLAMLQLQASMPEKVAGMRIVQFSDDPRVDSHALPALRALFRLEHHAGLSLKIADTLVRKCQFKADLALVAFMIRAWHGDGIAAAENALQSLFYGVEGFLMDSFALDEVRPSALTKAVLAAFSPSSLPADGNAVVQALSTISMHAADPFAAFAATGALGEAHQPNADGAKRVFETARYGKDAFARALAIRVLGNQPCALLPILTELKALTAAPDTDARVRRAAFYALINTHQSGLPNDMKGVIDLYFQYLREAPFAHFGDALHGFEVATQPGYFVQQFAASLDAIKSESARTACFHLLSAPFAFGIAPEFKPHWLAIVALMLRALDRPQDQELHYQIFWNLLHDVPMPGPAAAAFATGLKDRLMRVQYPERSRSEMTGWLDKHESKKPHAKMQRRAEQ